MRIIVGCEYSGTVREAFRRLGHDAWSCDLLPSEDNSPYHYQGDIFGVLHAEHFDLGIFHPPCTDLAVSGSRWFAGKQATGQQEDALDFVFCLMAENLHRWAVENPVSIISSRIIKPDQIIQPWQFGHRESKATCLWLSRLPKLVPTDVVGPPPKDMTAEERRAWHKVHLMPPGPERWRERSRTYAGIANAMATQWGAL